MPHEAKLRCGEEAQVEGTMDRRCHGYPALQIHEIHHFACCMLDEAASTGDNVNGIPYSLKKQKGE